MLGARRALEVVTLVGQGERNGRSELRQGSLRLTGPLGLSDESHEMASGRGCRRGGGGGRHRLLDVDIAVLGQPRLTY